MISNTKASWRLVTIWSTLRVLELILFNLSINDLKVMGWSALSASLQMIPN